MVGLRTSKRSEMADGEVDDTFAADADPDVDMDVFPEDDELVDEGDGPVAEIQQNAREKMEASSRKGFANVGILESLRVENFMCHRNFEFTFGPSMNVINGQNGSGKSAIVAALQIAFGVHASQTERGKKLSEHIMHGENQALIVVKIRNRPPVDGNVDERYRPDDYGDSIVIERRLTRETATKSNSSAWTFRNTAGKRVDPVDRPRTELDAIMDTFSIYVDNPVAILTQQKSKQFLNQGKPSGLFHFFRHATMLNKWEEDLLAVKKVHADLQALIAQKKSTAGKIDRELERIEQRFIRAKAVDEHEDNLARLKNEYAWAVVTELEKEVLKVENNMTFKQRKLEEMGSEMQEIAMKIEQSSDEQQQKTATLDELSEKINEEKSRLEELTAVVRSAKRKAGLTQNALASEKRLAEEAKRQKENAIKDMAAEQAKHEDTTGRRASILENIEKATESKSQVDREIEQCKVQRDAVDQAVVQFREENDHFRRQRVSLETRGRAIESEIRNASNAGSVRRFGNHVPGLLEKIEQNSSSFHRAPIGPIGQHISVSDERWAMAIESAIGDLSVFLVHDVHDEQIMRKFGQHKLITASFDAKLHEISDRNRAPLRTVLDEIYTESKEVFNALIDQFEIERIVLCDNKLELDKVAYDSSIPNVKMCFLPDGSRAFSKFGSRSFIPARPRAQVPKLQKDISMIVHRCKDDLASCRDELGKLETDQNDWETRRMAKTSEQTELHRREQSLQRKRQSICRELERLGYELDGASGGFEASAWEDRIEEETGKEAAHQLRVDEIEAELLTAKEAVLDAERKKENVMSSGERASDLHEKSTAIREELGHIIGAIKKKKIRIKTIESRMVPLEKEIATLMQDLADGRQTVHEDTQSAMILSGERITVEKSSREIQNLMDSMKGQIEIQRKKNSGLSREEAEQDYLRAKARKKENDKFMKDSERNLRSVKEGFKARKKRFNRQKKMLRAETSVMFGHYLGKRKHTGTLTFNDEDETLNIAVSMSHAITDCGDRVETKDLKALSGGEKSFTTLSFMLALGEQMHIPFRIMDEFDVFMDEANRRASWESLVQVARDSPNRQFIYITPLEMPKLPGVGGEGLRVQKLNPPSRNQLTLGEVGVGAK